MQRFVKHSIFAIPIQATAWGLLLLSLAFEPFRWFLIPEVNNTPAFITVSIGLTQSLFVTNMFGLAFYKIRGGDPKLSVADRRVASFHLLLSAAHIVLVGILIYTVAGFEDL